MHSSIILIRNWRIQPFLSHDLDFWYMFNTDIANTLFTIIKKYSFYSNFPFWCTRPFFFYPIVWILSKTDPSWSIGFLSFPNVFRRRCGNLTRRMIRMSGWKAKLVLSMRRQRRTHWHWEGKMLLYGATFCLIFALTASLRYVQGRLLIHQFIWSKFI